MKRVPIFVIALMMLVSSLGFWGCSDPADPEDNLDLMYDRPWREKALKNISEIYSKTMQENKNDSESPAVKELVNILVPGLIEGFKKFDRDKDNRKTIIELLAQMNDPRSEEVFIEAMELENTTETMMFETAATAVKRQSVDRAIPKLVAAAQKCMTARDSRGGAAFTNSENAIVQAFIGSSQAILEKHPNSSHKSSVVELLIKISDTPDTLQELRLNMRAIKSLGRIGDPAGIPVLIRGIAMRGTRQPIALGQFAFSALQQIPDRDAVVKGIIQFARREDQAFMKMFAKEIESDPVMKNPTWFIQQAASFFGELGYPSAAVLQFLSSELQHNEADDLDTKAAAADATYAAPAWAAMRRNWAAVAMAQLGQASLMAVIAERMGSGKLELEEKAGYIRAMGILLMPEQSCPILLKAIDGADDSLRDKIFYNASLMCGDSFKPLMDAAKKKIDCAKIIEQRFQGEGSDEEVAQANNECKIMISRIDDYLDRIKFGTECGANLDCYLKTVKDHTNKNVERAITSSYRAARDDKSKKDIVVKTLLENLQNPSMVALGASVSALDKLTPEGGKEIVDRVEAVYKNFARQSTYKDRARLLEAFSGHLRARTK